MPTTAFPVLMGMGLTIMAWFRTAKAVLLTAKDALIIILPVIAVILDLGL